VALYWVAYEITGSAMALGVLGLCEAAPRLFLGAVGGVLVDRYNRLRLLILIQFISLPPLLIFIALYYSGALAFWHILVLEIVSSIIRSVNPSASQSLVRDLVDEDELINAVSLYTIGFNVARIAGPSLGGVLVLLIGVGGCYLLYGLSLLAGGLAMFFIRVREKAIPVGKGNLLLEMREGFQYIRRAPVILAAISGAYILSIFVGSYTRFLPVFAKEILNVGPEGLGALMAAPGVGAILSLIFLATVGEKWKRERMLWVTASLTAAFLILFCLSSSFLLSVALLAVGGGAQVAFRTISRVVIQVEAPSHLLGRVMSVFVMDHGMRSIGSLVIGAFATLFGTALGLGLTSAVSLVLTSVLFHRLLRR
jgi:predicted MFS family arabinose efflux permease